MKRAERRVTGKVDREILREMKRAEDRKPERWIEKSPKI